MFLHRLLLSRNGAYGCHAAPHDGGGITEKLKACAPMRWVGLLNTLKAQAEEMIFAEIIWV